MSNLTKIIALNFLLALVFITCQYEQLSKKKTSSTSVTKPTKETVMDGLKRPWSMAFLSSTEALVAEKDGDLLKVNLSTKTKTIIQGFPTDVADSLVVIAKNYPLGTYQLAPMGLRGAIMREF